VVEVEDHAPAGVVVIIRDVTQRYDVMMMTHGDVIHLAALVTFDDDFGNVDVFSLGNASLAADRL
jgi:hypothetical protein